VMLGCCDQVFAPERGKKRVLVVREPDDIALLGRREGEEPVHVPDHPLVAVQGAVRRWPAERCEIVRAVPDRLRPRCRTRCPAVPSEEQSLDVRVQDPARDVVRGKGAASFAMPAEGSLGLTTGGLMRSIVAQKPNSIQKEKRFTAKTQRTRRTSKTEIFSIDSNLTRLPSRPSRLGGPAL